jgi:hypothetical protein
MPPGGLHRGLRAVAGMMAFEAAVAHSERLKIALSLMKRASD